jgi:hypothetical protein
MRRLSLLSVLFVACSSDPPATVVEDTAIADTAAANTAVVDTMIADTMIADTGMAAMDTAVTEAGDTWESWAKGFFAKYCVECHGATSTTRKYTAIDDVKRDALKIKCGTASVALAGCGSFPPPKQFPISNASKTNPKPTDAERARLVAWIEAGTP